MAKMIDAMERLVRGETPQPPAAQLIGMAVESFAPGEAVVVLQADARHGNPMGTVGLVECDVIDGEDGLVAHAVSTCIILRGQQAAGR